MTPKRLCIIQRDVGSVAMALGLGLSFIDPLAQVGVVFMAGGSVIVAGTAIAMLAFHATGTRLDEDHGHELP